VSRCDRVLDVAVVAVGGAQHAVAGDAVDRAERAPQASIVLADSSRAGKPDALGRDVERLLAGPGPAVASIVSAFAARCGKHNPLDARVAVGVEHLDDDLVRRRAAVAVGGAAAGSPSELTARPILTRAIVRTSRLRSHERRACKRRAWVGAAQARRLRGS
jgi:hypothetical protein